MSRAEAITGPLVARNWTYNLVGQTVALAVAVPATPYIVRSLGTERFGVLSIAWLLLGYIGVFDLGLGRATTKFVAECVARGDTRRLPSLVWTSVVSQVLFGIVGALLGAVIVLPLISNVLKISPSLTVETSQSFLTMLASLPLLLASNSLRGVLEAAQRFDLVNYVRVPANASVFLLPLAVLPFSAKLPVIVLLLVVARATSTIAYLLLCFKVIPALRRGLTIDREAFRPLMIYGGWVTVSNIVSPLLSYLDRFALGALVSMAAVGYYSVPAEAINRVSVVPSSLSTTLFPAFSSLHAAESKERIERVCARSLKALMLTIGPVSLLIAVFAREILYVWLGSEFADRGAIPLKILSIGLLFNSLAFVPFGLLQALGKPDLTAKFHLVELPLFALLLWYLLTRAGIAGAAMAWTIRVVVDAALLLGATVRFRWITPGGAAVQSLVKAALFVLGLGVLLFALQLTTTSLLTKCEITTLIFVGFGILSWKYLLESEDRNVVLSAFRPVPASLPISKSERTSCSIVH